MIKEVHLAVVIVVYVFDDVFLAVLYARLHDPTFLPQSRNILIRELLLKEMRLRFHLTRRFGNADWRHALATAAVVFCLLGEAGFDAGGR